jgi:hypothetical protein
LLVVYPDARFGKKKKKSFMCRLSILDLVCPYKLVAMLGFNKARLELQL